jgi:hypothetical protein
MSTLPNHPWMVGRALQLYRDAVAAGATPAEAAVHLADNIQHIEGLVIGEAEARVRAVKAYQDERRAVAEAEKLRVELREQAKPPHVCACPVATGPKEAHMRLERLKSVFALSLSDEALAALRADDETAWSYVDSAMRELVKQPAGR